ncbi:MAG: amino acid decarboxylase [Candidatus Eisenbacteria bacterium]|uniref:Amino acid decarboxylase n=1 Tax=Eiseniibacteriota bacterium TaxID=2212470 RepID=A0A956RPP4_UNCEI|nr:amino acid decarboxylase [Candidatus Eisenbacteria bacterium]
MESPNPDRGASESPAGPESWNWDPESFRAHGHRAVDWVADYLARVGELPVLPAVRPGDVARGLPEHPPEHGEPFDALLSDLDRVVVPGLTHWNHPGFFAYFGITASGPGILGELVASAFNTNGMLWKTSPATTEVEQHVLRWMLEMFDLPRDWFPQLVDTASIGTLVALAAAREAQADLEIRKEGLAAPGHPRLRAYASEQAHSSVEKALITLGLGQAGLRKIPTDESFRMDVRALRQAVEEDRADGWRPFAVIATVGTTSTTSVDPVSEIADLCREHRLWLHVDAAYAGTAALLPEMRAHFAGCDRADSYLMNPHKWMFVPIDCSAFYTAHPDVLQRAFQLVPDYLRTEPAAHATDLMNYGVQLGRRFRAIKLWWVIRTFGVEGLRSRVREHCRLARELARWIGSDDRFEISAPAPFSTVCFRGRWPGLPDEGEDAANEDLARRVSGHGPVFLATTRLRGRTTLRLAIGNLRSEESHVRLAWELLQSEHAAAGENAG